MIGSIDFSWNSLFVSCNLIGQFCLSDPGNSSRTVNRTKNSTSLITLLPCAMRSSLAFPSRENLLLLKFPNIRAQAHWF